MSLTAPRTLVTALAVAGIILTFGTETLGAPVVSHGQSNTADRNSIPRSSTAVQPTQRETGIIVDKSQTSDFSGVTAPIKVYQKAFSSVRSVGCQFDPSCSEYARQAIRRHGLLLGSALAADRLNRCNGGAPKLYRRTPSGRLLDPVPGTGDDRCNTRTVPSRLLPEVHLAKPRHICRYDTLTGQRLDTLWFAFELMEEADYFRAVTEFKRAASLSDDLPASAMAQFYAGECRFGLGDWRAAIREYARTVERYPNTTWAGHAAFMAGVAYYNLGSHSACRREMDAFIYGTSTGELSDEALFITGLSHLEEGQWRSGSEVFGRAGSLLANKPSPYRFDWLAQESLQGEDLPGRSGLLASVLSIVLPGAGQMYSGRVVDGFRALTVNGLLVFSTYKLVEDEHYAGAYLLSGLTVPFYVGNIIGAHRAATDYNIKQRWKFIDSLACETEEAAIESRVPSQP